MDGSSGEVLHSVRAMVSLSIRNFNFVIYFLSNGAAQVMGSHRQKEAVKPHRRIADSPGTV